MIPQPQKSFEKPSSPRSYVTGVILLVFGFFIAVIFLVLGNTLKDRNDQKSFFNLPVISVESIRQQGSNFAKMLHKTASSPLFIISATLIAVSVAAGVVLYFVYPRLIDGNLQSDSVIPLPPSKNIEEAPQNHSSPSIISQVIYSILIISIFSVVLYFLIKMGGSLDFRLLLGMCAVFVVVMFLLVRFQDFLIPIVLYFPKKLIRQAAESTIESISV